MLRRPAFAWPRGVREAGLAFLIATGVLLFLTTQDPTLTRGLETASLDLRFRLRGVQAPEPETVIVLVDDHSLAKLGRWPLSRRLFAKAVQMLDRAGARVIAFDVLAAFGVLCVAGGILACAWGCWRLHWPGCATAPGHRCCGSSRPSSG